MRTDRIKSHFEEEAQEYDTIIQKLIPRYDEMVEALVSVIPFPENSAFSMIDLGCGTGTISKAVATKFPKVGITLVDIAGRMLEIASTKIDGDVRCVHADFNAFEFPGKYDLMVSSLALHHLETDADKLEFYKKIYAALTDDGVFVNIDVVLGSDEAIQSVYMNKWKEFMLRNMPAEEVNNKWLPNYYAEDRPRQLTAHLDMLKTCGFSCVDVIYKYYNYAVYMGKK